MIVRTDHNGEGRRDEALATLAEKRELYVLRGRRALLAALLAHGTATADDVRAAVELPPGIDPKCFGAVATPLAKAGIIEREGFAQTSRPTAHARPVSIWKLADHGKAERWLLDNPDRGDDDHDGEQGLSFPVYPKSPNNEPGATAATVAPGME